MNIWLTIKLAIIGLLANKMRAFLTLLGTIIGVSSIIVIVSVGNGAESLIVNQVQSIGSNLIGILPGGSEEEEPPAALFGIIITTLKYDDIKAIEELPYITAAAGFNQSVEEVLFKNKKTETTISGTFASYIEVEDTVVENGRFFNESEERNNAKVVVLGSSIKEELFSNRNPIGESIKIRGISFKVIGYMNERGASGFTNNDTTVFIPIKTMHKLVLGINHISAARAKVTEESYTEEAVESIKTTLRIRHGIDNPKDDDFTVESQAQGLETLRNITGSIKLMLTAIAAIALIVGGIGIMNVMFIAVTERTREIGLRKAIGANQSNILTQFLIEAVAITGIGGIMGILIGAFFSALVAFIIQSLDYKWDLIVTADSVIISTAVIVLIGIVFGYAPARKASKLNAIEALRYE